MAQGKRDLLVREIPESAVTDEEAAGGKVWRGGRRSGSGSLDAEAGLATLLGGRRTNPHDAALHRVRGEFVHNELDMFAAFEAECSSDPETVL